MTALKHPTNRSHLAKLEDILISPVFVHLCGPPVNRKSFILPLLSRRRKVATPISFASGDTSTRRSESYGENWERVIPLFEFPAEVRRVIPTTNAVGSRDMSLRKII